MFDLPTSPWLAGLVACAGLMAPAGPACLPTDLDARQNAWMDPGILWQPHSTATPAMEVVEPRQRVDPEMVQPVPPPDTEAERPCGPTIHHEPQH